jgi:hypothetical protein
VKSVAGFAAGEVARDWRDSDIVKSVYGWIRIRGHGDLGGGQQSSSECIDATYLAGNRR